MNDIFKAQVDTLGFGKVATIEHGESIRQAITFMGENRFGALPVMDQAKMVGIISEKDFLMRMGNDFETMGDKSVSEIMTPEPISIKASDEILLPMSLMRRHEFRHLPIVDDSNNVIGMVSNRDILRFLYENFRSEIERIMGDISSIEVGAIIDENFTFERMQKDTISSNYFYHEIHKVYHNDLLSIEEGTTIWETVKLMRESKSNVVVVTEYETRLKGILTERDLMCNYYLNIETLKNQPIKELMTADPKFLYDDNIYAMALHAMYHNRFRHLVILDRSKYPIYIISLLGLINELYDELVQGETL